MLMELEVSTSKQYGDLCTYWDIVDNIVRQHNEIKTSFETFAHLGHTFKRLQGFVSKYVFMHVDEEFDRIRDVGIDSERYCCILRCIHNLPCACIECSSCYVDQTQFF